MSECPNCGSARDDSYNPIIDVPSMDIRWHCSVYSFASGQIAHGETLARGLIRSLREELVISRLHSVGYLAEASTCEEVQAVICNNEHRSNT